MAARTGLLQIGQVAERTGLSLRTIRFYEENGLVRPTSRSDGGFRLYSEDDVARLEVIKRMKPLGFRLEEMQELLTLLADLAEHPGDAALTDRLRMFHEARHRPGATPCGSSSARPSGSPPTWPAASADHGACGRAPDRV